MTLILVAMWSGGCGQSRIDNAFAKMDDRETRPKMSKYIMDVEKSLPAPQPPRQQP